MNKYNAQAVDNAIRASRQKIGKREAKLIHALLKGRTDDTPSDRTRGSLQVHAR